jgi:hypothetical protein
MKKIGILLGVLFLTQVVSAQWSKGKGKGYYKLSAWYLNTDQHFTDTGEIDPNVTRTQFNVNFYGEYGISDRWDVIAYVPFFARTTQNNIFSGTTGNLIQEGEELNSLGDIDLGLNYNFFRKGNWSASAKLIFGLPTGEDAGGSDGSYQTGDGEFNQYLSGLLGYSTSFNGTPFFAKTYVGFNNRTENFSDELRFGLESGINLFQQKVWLIGRLDVVQSLQNGSLNAQNTPQGSIFANNIEFVGVGAEASYYITEKMGISVGVGGAISGRIIAANPSFTAGIFLDIK